MPHAAMGSLAAGLHLRDASSLVRTPCSTSYLVPPPTRPVRRRGPAPPQAAAKEVCRRQRNGRLCLPDHDQACLHQIGNASGTQLHGILPECKIVSA